MKKLIDGLTFAVGALLGYLIGSLVLFIILRVSPGMKETLAPPVNYGVLIVFSLLFGLILLKSAPALKRAGIRLGESLNRDLSGVSAGTIIGGTIGLIAGLLIAFLASQMLQVIRNVYVHAIAVVALYLVLIFVGTVVGASRGGDISSLFGGTPGTRKKPGAALKTGKTGRRKGGIPKILDTSVIIDGRVADILKSGFLEGPIVVPDFVLVELRHIADSSNPLKRARGRRGLDILNRIREEQGIEVYNTDGEKSLKDVPEVDVKLLKLTQILSGKVVTNDYNLNKVASVDGVPVLNINELANYMKPAVLPGETLEIRLVKSGKDPDQAVGYRDDGTMVVVENGASEIGKTKVVTVTSVLQTPAGCMIFARF